MTNEPPTCPTVTLRGGLLDGQQLTAGPNTVWEHGAVIRTSRGTYTVDAATQTAHHTPNPQPPLPSPPCP
jgi:hypothetical protein